MIIIIVLILAVISGIFMYNKFQQQELKQLTEEANKLLQQDLINDEIDNEIKTNKNYAIVEKTIKEYLTNIKNTYLEIEQLNSALDADKVFSASNVEDKAFKNVDNLIEEDKQKGKENVANSIEILAEIQKTRPNSLLVRTFFDAKGDELVSIFSGGPQTNNIKLLETLNRISPLNSQKWNKIR